MKAAIRHFGVSPAHSVRTRLTIWYVSMMAGIIFIFGGSLYVTQTFLNTQVADSTLEAQLYQDSQRFAAIYTQAQAENRSLMTLKLNQSVQEVVLFVSPIGNVLDSRGPLTESMFQQLQDRATQNAGLIELTAPQDALPNASHGWWWAWTATPTYRVLITPVLDQNTRIGILLVGLQRREAVPFVLIWLFWGGLAMLVTALGGYWLAGKVLHPIKAITRLANEISATDLRRRLQLQHQDEFGQLAATFDQMLARLEAAFQRQTQFAADASHELRTPLTVIGLDIHRALTELEMSQEHRQVLEQIRVENEQMTAIVNSLLLLARADTGQMKLDWQAVDLSDIALASIERLIPLARQHRIALATGNLPEVLIRGDARYLGQMLTNLIHNGIKFTSGIGTHVFVEVSCEGKGWAVVRVKDDGPGISDEHLPHLFERFYRVDVARSRVADLPGEEGRRLDYEAPGGSGLGLSIVQWIAQAHGGQIRVDSNFGSGTLFEVRLPVMN